MIVASLVLFAIEFVVDKIAVLDSVWDAVHVVLRPAVGAAILAVAPDIALATPAALLVGGGLALISHSAKAATRALVNTSPEPVSNVVVSTAEDGLVAALMALAFAYPEIALSITLVLVGVSVGLIVLAWRLVRGFRERLRGGRSRAVDDRDAPGSKEARATSSVPRSTDWSRRRGR